MRKFVNFFTRVSWLGLIENNVMPKNNEKVYYAVGKGRTVGVFDSWDECKAQTEGIPNAKYRKFFSLSEAEEFIDFWKNYSSPVKESDESTNSVSNRGRYDYNKGNYQRGKQTHGFAEKTNSFMFGNENRNAECFKHIATPYNSPLLVTVPSEFINLGNRNRNKTVRQRSLPRREKNFQNYSRTRKNSHSFKLSERRNTQVQITKPSPKPSQQCQGLGTSVSHPVTEISLVECSGVVNTSHTTENSLFENSYSSDRLSVDLTVADDSVTVKTENTDEKEKDKSHKQVQSVQEESNISDKLTASLEVLESSLMLIMKHGGGHAETLKDFLKTLIEKVYTNTNTNVNLQIGSSENIDRICEGSKNCDKSQPGSVSVSAATANQQQTFQSQCSQTPQIYMQTASPHSTSFEEKSTQRTADVLALNLRLDSFEKRFDVCLKEVGALVAEISHIKEEIKEVKEALNSKSPNKQSGSSYSPRKSKDGMFQTTLSFNPDVPNKSYSTYEDNSSFESSGLKRGKKLKRKLSRNDSYEDSKRFADDEKDGDDILRKIKTEAVDYTSFVVDDDDYVEVYTDGASQSNGKDNAKAGIGVWWKEGHPLNVAEPVIGPPTNNTAEIQAARVAIELAIKSGIKKLKIFTDSEFLINCATRWIHRWKKNGWVLVNGGPVKNKNELEKLDKVAAKISVRWEKVAGHAGVIGNEMADRLANEGAAKYKR